jgi:membrane protein
VSPRILSPVSLLFTAAAIGFLIAGVTCLVAAQVMLAQLPSFAAAALDYLRWPALLAITTLTFASIYRYGPSRATSKWRWISRGSVAASIAWLGTSALFSWYAANFGSFNKTYGSLGAAIGFMTWIWLSVIIVLLGGKVNAETEQQTAKNSTVGPPTFGRSACKMADTVG